MLFYTYDYNIAIEYFVKILLDEHDNLRFKIHPFKITSIFIITVSNNSLTHPINHNINKMYLLFTMVHIKYS